MAEETIIVEETPVAPKQSALAGTMLTAGAVAAGVAIGISVGLFVLGPRLAPGGGTHTAAAAPASEPSSGEGGTHSGPSPIYLMENLVINPANSGGSRFLLISVGLAARNEAGVTLLRERDAELRDNVLRIFGAKTIEQVADISARDGLRAELAAQLDKVVPHGTIRRVYFPQFVIQ
jgi:flagellar FliL protein